VRASYLLTTACGDHRVANTQYGGGGIYSKTIGDRLALLRERILPAAVGQDLHEIIVCGRFPQSLVDEFDDTVTFITLPPQRLDRIEAFRQRECAGRFSTGDVLIASADDHMLTDGFVDTLRDIMSEEWDILTPKRVHGITNETLNNGENEGYSPWHVQCIKRHAWAMCPFVRVDTLWSDIVLPEHYKEMNLKMTWDDRLVVVDVEAMIDW
jgi:hypothetical protein